MKTTPWRIAMATLTAIILTGCVSRTERRAEVIIAEPPPSSPPATVEVRPSAPPGHVWVDGRWTYRDRRWVWEPGHYVSPPRSKATYVPGRWERHRNGYVWREGYWR